MAPMLQLGTPFPHQNSQAHRGPKHDVTVQFSVTLVIIEHGHLYLRTCMAPTRFPPCSYVGVPAAVEGCPYLCPSTKHHLAS